MLLNARESVINRSFMGNTNGIGALYDVGPRLLGLPVLNACINVMLLPPHDTNNAIQAQFVDYTFACMHHRRDFSMAKE